MRSLIIIEKEYPLQRIIFLSLALKFPSTVLRVLHALEPLILTKFLCGKHYYYSQFTKVEI